MAETTTRDRTDERSGDTTTADTLPDDEFIDPWDEYMSESDTAETVVPESIVSETTVPETEETKRVRVTRATTTISRVKRTRTETSAETDAEGFYLTEGTQKTEAQTGPTLPLVTRVNVH